MFFFYQNPHKNLLKNQLQLFKAHNFKLDQHKVLLTVSGGVDSMCLLDFWLSIRHTFSLKIFIAHVNHGLRPLAYREEQFLEKYCKKKYLPFFVKNLNPQTKPKRQSLEEWGRTQRYLFFDQLKQTYHIDFIFTAHHLNDQWETLLLNILRGTGLQGLQGIHFSTKQGLIRPFLKVSKKTLLKYAHKNRLTWFEDDTNQNLDFERNWIRKNYPAQTKQLKQTHRITTQVQVLWKNLQNIFKQNIQVEDTHTYIPYSSISKWFKSNPWLYFHDFQYLTQTQKIKMSSHHFSEIIRQFKQSPYNIKVQIDKENSIKINKQKGAYLAKN